MGGPTELWNTTWTPAEINSPNFGFMYQLGTSLGTSIAYVDNIQATVYYTTPATTLTPTPTKIPTLTPTITPITTPTPGVSIHLVLALPGIGGAPSNSSNNHVPKQQIRTATVELLNAGNQVVATQSAGLSYGDGTYNGLVPMGVLTPGPYAAKVRLSNTLWKRIPGIITVTSGTQVFDTAALDLIPGDLSQENTIDLLDYNAVIACYQGTCPNDTKTQVDFNDDGVVDAKDLNILLRAFSQRQGD